MRIYFTPGTDPMITDTVDGLTALAARLATFVSSSEAEFHVHADTSGSAKPHETLLPGITFSKSGGPILVTLDHPRGLRVTGSRENLRLWCSHFEFPLSATDGNHHHPEQIWLDGYTDSCTLSVIIEVQTDE